MRRFVALPGLILPGAAPAGCPVPGGLERLEELGDLVLTGEADDVRW